ncbi:MAG: protein kinase [Candidatus Solibacter sp.]|nr:protein kinase [Candidatus Solibacter sp.]
MIVPGNSQGRKEAATDVGDTRLDFVSKEAACGELLSEKLARGCLPAEEALRYAIEIGAALHKVHSRGLVHGALSPFCIALTAGGARILEATPLPDDHAAYQAPEQILGDPTDARSDVFGYGALVYEIASGKRAFPGAGAELCQNILTQSPAPLTAVCAMPAAVERVVAGCLEKDPAQRRQRVQNAVIELRLAARCVARGGQAARCMPVRPTPAHAPAGSGGRRAVRRPSTATTAAGPAVAPHAAEGSKAVYGLSFKLRLWGIGGGLLALAASSVAAVLLLQRKPAPPVLQFAVAQPENTSFPGMPSVSPDGRYLTFPAVGPDGKRMLWLRPLDALKATVIQGSEGASAPFWSPDSQAIAFFGGRYLKKARITGGTPENICEAEAAPGGGSWSRDGTILFAPSFSDGLYLVAASGGKPRQVLKLDESKLERADLWPQFLPDGKHFLFYRQTDLTETSGVYVGSIDQPGYRRLFTSQTNAVYSAAAPETPEMGYLLYINERTLMVRQFNPSRLETGQAAIALSGEIGAVRSLALAPISVSTTGVLVYRGAGQAGRQMVWIDRDGQQLAVAGEPGTWGPPRISPDGNRAIAAKTGPDGTTAHLWLLDVSGAARQISDGAMHEGSPVWSPDARRIAYLGKQGDAYDIFARDVHEGAEAELLLRSADRKFPSDWSRDGKYITYTVEGAGTRLDLWGMSMRDGRAAPILETVHAEGFATISPDGKWVAYQSDESGHNEVYVQAFEGLNTGTTRRWLVSKGGGLPRWRSDSGELFYMTMDGRIMSVSIHLGSDGGIEAGQPRLLFRTRPVPKSWNLYDVTPDGRRFSVNIPLEWTSAGVITVVTNWTEKLRR